MRVDINLHQADFQRALDDLLPVTIWLDGEKRRWIWLGKAKRVAVEQGVGLRAAVPLKLQWVANVEAEIADLTMMPEIAPKAGGFELVFHLGLDSASLKGVPGLFDGTVVSAVNAALDRVHLAWGYSNTLNQTFAIRGVFDKVDGVSLQAGAGTAQVGTDTITLSVQLQVGFSRIADK